MAASMKKKVHVEIEASDSEHDDDIAESSSSNEEKDTSGSDGEQDDDEAVESPTSGKTGLADVLAKILHKNVPSHKQVILSKGKTDKEIRKRKLEREEEEGEGDNKVTKIKTESKENQHQLAKEERAKLWENMCRSKPDPLQRDKERQLQKIATRGVVQLFNAVRKQQKLLEDEIQQVGVSERKKDKIMEGMTKDKFLTILKGTSKTNVKAEKPEMAEPVSVKQEEENDSESDDEDDKKSGKKWNILSEDYMMGAKMKDWDKEDSDDDGDDNNDDDVDPDLSDSD